MTGWTFHPAAKAFPEYAVDWDKLNAQLFESHPLFDSRFIGALLDHFSTGNEQLCLHHSPEGINGALILSRSGFGKWSLFLPAQTQIGAVMIGDGAVLSSLMTSLPGVAWLIELLALDPEYDPYLRSLDLPRWTIPHHKTIAISLAGTFDDYLNRRPKSLLNNVRRYQARADEECGPSEIRLFDSCVDIPSGIERFAEIESAGWKGRAGTAIEVNNRQGYFYKDVLSRFAASRQAIVAELFLGTQLAASRLMIISPKINVMLKTTYDEAKKNWRQAACCLLKS